MGVGRFHRAVWNWVRRLADSGHDPTTATPSRVAVDETAVKINGERSWLYTAIGIETKLILDVVSFSLHETDPATSFLQKIREKHGLSEFEFLVDRFGYRTALSPVELSGRVNYTDRNPIESSFTPSKYESIASITHGWAVGQAHASGLNSLYSTTTARGRINRLMEKHRLTRY
ncbi:putative transposase [Natrialba aegyptia DSM 13077]|uniref:Putative transposase n=1 Tax=Natrialba aegyptia DSM 13077 TaxID=1227491 RepID=M0AS01_9EURY|nr:putative transposase [Natrialba aegyptia DSM 13077]